MALTRTDHVEHVASKEVGVASTCQNRGTSSVGFVFRHETLAQQTLDGLDSNEE